MKIIRIIETLIQAESLAQMADSSGKRIMNLPFYCETEDGKHMIFHTLSGSTNAVWLKEMIESGRIYIRRHKEIDKNVN